MENLRVLTIKQIEEETALKRQTREENEILGRELEQKSKLNEHEFEAFLEEREMSQAVGLKIKLDIQGYESEYFIVR